MICNLLIKKSGAISGLRQFLANNRGICIPRPPALAPNLHLPVLAPNLYLAALTSTLCLLQICIYRLSPDWVCIYRPCLPNFYLLHLPTICTHTGCYVDLPTMMMNNVINSSIVYRSKYWSCTEKMAFFKITALHNCQLERNLIIVVLKM